MSEDIFDPKSHTILIVDDEIALRDAVAFDFKRKGYQVLVASNGIEAFEIVQKEKVDVVLSDMRMPGGDGMDLLRSIKSSSPNKPVVMFITGFADITSEEAYHEGADAVFSKPFDRKMLQMAVTQALTSKEARLKKIPEATNPAAIALRFANLDVAVNAKLLSLGRGGMCVVFQKGEKPLPPTNTNIGFKIEFDPEKASPGRIPLISGEGTIRWARKETADRSAACGIEFSYLTEECRAQVLSLIESLHTKSFIPSIGSSS